MKGIIQGSFLSHRTLPYTQRLNSKTIYYFQGLPPQTRAKNCYLH